MTTSKNIRLIREAACIGAVGLICGLCTVFSGCQPQAENSPAIPQARDTVEPTKKIEAAVLTPQQIERLEAISGNLAEKETSDAVKALVHPEPTENSTPVPQTLRPDNATEDTYANLPDGMELGVVSQSPSDIYTNEAIPHTTGPVALVDIPVLNEPGMSDALISVNFEEVDIRKMLKTIGDITGINFIIEKTVQGNVTVMSPTKVRMNDLYQFLESVLDVHGYSAVPSEKFVKIIPKDDAVKRHMSVQIGSNPATIPRTDTVVRQLIPLKYADAVEVSELIKPMLSGSVAPYPRTNSILITDTSANVRHIAELIQRLDVTGAKEKVTVVRLQYASAEVLSEQITQIVQKDQANSVQTPIARKKNGPSENIRVMANARINSLIIVANAQDTEMIKRLAHQLDVERPATTNNVHVVFLQNAPAKQTAESLTNVLPGLQTQGFVEAGQSIKVTHDEGTNALIVTATPQDFEVISGMIEQLDIVRENVLVEMLIMEVSEDSLEEIGIDWATLDEAVQDSIRGFAATNFGIRSAFVTGDLEGLAVGTWQLSDSGTRIGTILHALAKSSGVNILSTPHVTTSNHQLASIIVGENIPYIKESRITETVDLLTPTVIDTWDYKDVGISLEITPHINQGGLVTLNVDSKFTKQIEGVTGSSVDTPTTAKREVQTTVSLKSGSTVVVGGLIRDDKVSVEKKIPFLGDLPLLGGLFRLNRDQWQKTNLLLFITPHILKNQADMEEITERKKAEMQPAVDELRDKN